MSLSIQETPSKEPWSNKKSIVIAIISLIIGISIFTLAYLGMSKNIGIGFINEPIMEWVTSNRQSVITDVYKIITTTMSPKILMATITLLAIIWAIIKREIWRPLLLMMSTALGVISSYAIKNLTSNQRPTQSNMITPFETDFSFPSNHTIGIVVFFLVISYLLCSRKPENSRIIFFSIISTLAIVIVGSSRIYLGYHWTTDVIASLGLGFIVLAITILIDKIMASRRTN